MAYWQLGCGAWGAVRRALVRLLALIAFSGGAAHAADSLYIVAKVTVDATAQDAVAAKAKGMEDAERNALNVVLKRLVPLSAYAQLPDLSSQDVEDLIEGVSIRSEQNSNTRYLASLDVSFNSQAVKQLLDSQNIAYSEARAEAISILPLVLDGASVKREGAEGWQQAWESVDLANSVTPATTLRPRADLAAATIKSVLGGDAQAFALMQSAYSYGPLVIAVAEIDGGKFVTRLVGADSVGPINYGHSDVIAGGNAKDAAKGAAAVAFGIIENRWKVDTGPDPGADRGPYPGPGRSRPDAANRQRRGAAQRRSHGRVHRAQELAGDQGAADAGRRNPGARGQRAVGSRCLDHLRLCRLARQIADRAWPKRIRPGRERWNLRTPREIGRRGASAPGHSSISNLLKSPVGRLAMHPRLVGLREERLVNIPNSLTLGRIVLVPLVVWLIITHEMLPAFLLFLLAGLSDAADGFLAKRYGWNTELGAYLDPIADKALLVSIYVTLGLAGQLPAWLVIAVVSRDILIVGAVVLSWMLSRPLMMKPLLISKANTFSQIVLAGLVLAELGLGLGLEGLVALLIWVTGTLTIVSAAAYFLSWLRQMASYEPQSKQVPWRKRDGVEHAPSERVPADRSGARAS